MDNDDAKKRVWCIRPKSGGSWLMGERLSDLAEQIENEDYPSEYQLKTVEMTAAEIEQLGEWDGW